jgi:hypothetical protein
MMSFLDLNTSNSNPLNVWLEKNESKFSESEEKEKRQNGIHHVSSFFFIMNSLRAFQSYFCSRLTVQFCLWRHLYEQRKELCRQSRLNRGK